MRLFVMRHGHSLSACEAGVASDAERPLSAKGKADTLAQACAMLETGDKPALILHSPLRRAAQTAAQMSGALGAPAAPLAALANELGPEDLARALEAPLAQAGQVLVVGHQPQVGEFCSWLCGCLFDFKPAGWVVIEADALAARAGRVLQDRCSGA